MTHPSECIRMGRCGTGPLGISVLRDTRGLERPVTRYSHCFERSDRLHDCRSTSLACSPGVSTRLENLLLGQ